MKNLKPIISIIIVMLLFVSCSDDDSGNTNTVDLTQLTNIVEAGTWRVASFIDSGENETSDFAGYNFNFRQDGTVTASNGSRTVNGTWSVTDSNSGDDSPDDADFNLFFSVDPDDDFEDLNDDWDVVSITENRIELIDISGGNGGTDNLRFEKN